MLQGLKNWLRLQQQPQQYQREICDNGLDDDWDGYIDCDDPDCYSYCEVPPPLPPYPEYEICDNNFDDDRDGWIDCSDSECFEHPYCSYQPSYEICNNGLDDDKDGAVDCDDFDCKSLPQCQGTPPGVNIPVVFVAYCDGQEIPIYMTVNPGSSGTTRFTNYYAANTVVNVTTPMQVSTSFGLCKFCEWGLEIGQPAFLPSPPPMGTLTFTVKGPAMTVPAYYKTGAGCGPGLVTTVKIHASCNKLEPGVTVQAYANNVFVGSGPTPLTVQMTAGFQGKVTFPASFPFQGGTCYQPAGVTSETFMVPSQSQPFDFIIKYSFTPGQKYEVCNNGVDDDNDGYIDCKDSDCFQHPYCKPTPSNLTIEEAVAQHSGNPKMIEDVDILWALQLWMKAQEVPGTSGQKISDITMLKLLHLWIKGQPISSTSAQGSPERTPPYPSEAELAVRAVDLFPNPIKSNSTATFRVEGSGIARVKIGVFSLTGMRVFEQEAVGNTLRFYALDDRGRPLANGVYLYVVRVQGYDGQEYVIEIRKLVIVR